MIKGKRGEGLHYSIFATAIGFGGVVAGKGGLLEVFTPFQVSSREEVEQHIRESYPEATGESPLTRKAARLLEEYFRGKPVDFDLPVDPTLFTPFQNQVYEIVRRISHGTVRSYGDIAQEMGRPRAARGVGSAMARNPLPVIIPCHRVIGAAGSMTGYSAPGGVGSKKWLLTLEGARLDNRISKR